MTRGDYAKLQFEIAKTYATYWQAQALVNTVEKNRKDALEISLRHIHRMNELSEFIASDKAKEEIP